MTVKCLMVYSFLVDAADSRQPHTTSDCNQCVTVFLFFFTSSGAAALIDVLSLTERSWADVKDFMTQQKSFIFFLNQSSVKPVNSLMSSKKKTGGLSHTLMKRILTKTRTMAVISCARDSGHHDQINPPEPVK